MLLYVCGMVCMYVVHAAYIVYACYVWMAWKHVVYVWTLCTDGACVINCCMCVMYVVYVC